MSKSKETEAPVAQLTLVNFDDLDAIEVEESAPAPVEQPSAPVETEEQVLATVETFDSAFVNDPCKQRFLDWANHVKAGVDPSDLGIKFVGYGCELQNIMIEKKNLAPGAYDRAKVMKQAESALRQIGRASCRERV